MMHVLIVDDSPAARDIAEAAIEDAAEALGLSIIVESAENGVVAIRALTTKFYDVMLVDLHMPDMTGLEVLNFWRGRPAEKPRMALVVSSEVSSRDREKVQLAGASGFVEKPATGDALVGFLKTFVESNA